MPVEVARRSVSRPFRDAWAYVSDLTDAKSENEQLRDQVEALRQQAIQEQTATRENQRLGAAPRYRRPELSSGLPRGRRPVDPPRPPSPYRQEVVIAAGRGDGVEINDFRS